MDAESTPAFMDCTVVWTPTDTPVKYEDSTRQYRFEGHIATAQLEAKIRVPDIGFTFTTDPLSTSTCDFAVIGNAVNGKYY